MAATSVAARQLQLHQQKKRAKKLARRIEKIKQMKDKLNETK